MNLGSSELLIVLTLCTILVILPITLAIVATRRAGSRRRTACPFCAEMIVPEAKVCRFCGRELPAGWTQNSKL